jgi:hypothetical protein
LFTIPLNGKVRTMSILNYRYLLLTIIIFVLFNQLIQTSLNVNAGSSSLDDSLIEEEPVEEILPDETEESSEEITEEESSAEDQPDIDDDDEILEETPTPEIPTEDHPTDSIISDEDVEPDSDADADADADLILEDEIELIPPLDKDEPPDEPEIEPLLLQPSAAVGLLDNVRLIATRETIGGKEKVTLALSGRSILNLGLLNSTYVIFQLPPEIAGIAHNMKATYDVPGLILRNRGSFRQDEIKIQGNQVYIDFKRLITINIISNYYFNLEFTVEALPPNSSGIYTFRSQATRQLVNLSELETTEPVGKDTLDAPLSVLEFSIVPSALPFNATKISSKHVLIQRQDPNWGLQVRDTRGQGKSWRITAQVARPLTSVNDPSKILQDALVYRNANGSTSLSNGPVEVFRGTTGNNPLTNVSWSSNQGPLIQVIPSEASADQYATTITWTLVDAP